MRRLTGDLRCGFPFHLGRLMLRLWPGMAWPTSRGRIDGSLYAVGSDIRRTPRPKHSGAGLPATLFLAFAIEHRRSLRRGAPLCLYSSHDSRAVDTRQRRR
jgi:hypothetical protein